ncbi:hypothetical protein LDO26_03475 [Luteimonas sp. BDR2-5]|uniref:hypothetical protein n=1 Tax=Proluteimonas luteida TaxID=2878685 RepID=UPI001E43ECCC|nr:hypothetical protein [Luteimonas sp. BDR2-5]MCD9027275.1 hypothetical protein [Luteimonas sp. BDR2-5]
MAHFQCRCHQPRGGGGDDAACGGVGGRGGGVDGPDDGMLDKAAFLSAAVEGGI